LPLNINKTIKKNSIKYYEVIWSKLQSDYDEDLSNLKGYSSIEKAETFLLNYPIIVNDYETKLVTSCNKLELCISKQTKRLFGSSDKKIENNVPYHHLEKKVILTI
jgi:hypothetical protein